MDDEQGRTEIAETHRFTCNLCGAACESAHLDREAPSCAKCGSSVRERWIIHALSTGLFGPSLALPDMPVRREIRGIGMSDPPRLAAALAARFSYENTFYHKPPYLDITKVTDEAVFDFIITSEVFEHVAPPVQTAFNNLARLLKPDGVAVFTVPWGLQSETVEHFPNLYDWKVVELRSGHVLLNRTKDGRYETHENLAFHGGPGSTLEMRLFSHAALLEHFRVAGFATVLMAEDYPRWGIAERKWSRGFLLRKGMA